MRPWQPVIDGDVIQAPPLDCISTGAAANIDLMFGTTTDEWRLFMVPNGMVGQITEAMLPGAIAAYGIPVDAVLATYRATRRGASAGDLLTAIMGDWYFRIPAMRLPGVHPSSTAPWVHVTASKFLSSSTHWAMEPSCFWGKPHRNNLPTSCTPLGWPSRPPAIAVGRSTRATTGLPCGSIQDQRSWRIPGPRCEPCGNGSVR